MAAEKAWKDFFVKFPEMHAWEIEFKGDTSEKSMEEQLVDTIEKSLSRYRPSPGPSAPAVRSALTPRRLRVDSAFAPSHRVHSAFTPPWPTFTPRPLCLHASLANLHTASTLPSRLPGQGQGGVGEADQLDRRLGLTKLPTTIADDHSTWSYARGSVDLQRFVRGDYSTT